MIGCGVLLLEQSVLCMHVRALPLTHYSSCLAEEVLCRVILAETMEQMFQEGGRKSCFFFSKPLGICSSLIIHLRCRIIALRGMFVLDSLSLKLA